MSHSTVSKCSEKTCHAPLSPCAAGEEHWTNCPLWCGANEDAERDNSKVKLEVPPPWSGCALGMDDVDVIAARGTPHVIGVIGPHNAGKTTLLAAWYLLLCRGRRVPDRQFAGSASFEGWESLAHWMRWDPQVNPTFPPHTTMGQGRQPGLLHLAFRRSSGSLEDVLLTDAPGEWFEKWAVQRADSEAAGGRWIIKHADIFLFIVDSESLTGPDRGRARGLIVQLARRLRDERGQRPVCVLWTKTDVSVGADLKANLTQDLATHLPEARSFEVSVQHRPEDDIAQGLMAVLAAALPPAAPSRGQPIVLSARESTDPLLLYRG